jgi:hypothetical protein
MWFAGAVKQDFLILVGRSKRLFGFVGVHVSQFQNHLEQVKTEYIMYQCGQETI